MAHIRGKKALYEVISKTRTQPRYNKTVEPLRQDKSSTAEPIIPKVEPAATVKVPQWRKKPNIIQLNAGRIEVSIPYQLAIVFILCLVLLILVAFRLGQFTQRAAKSSARTQSNNRASVAEGIGAKTTRTSGLNENLFPSSETIKPAELKPTEAKGDHVIVIVQYQSRADLVPVQQYFAESGIETEIVQQAGWYFLLTKNRYDNPTTPGTDGYKIRRQIIDLGPKYKAPRGYETFATTFFRDAYGKKVK